MNPLAELQDIHLPNDIGFWPPGPGWWILLVTLIFCTALLWWWLKRTKQKRLARKQALQELMKIDRNTPDWPLEINRLLKRVALSYYPHAQVAKLYGEQWQNFLCAQVSDNKRVKIEVGIERLQAQLYKNVTNTEDFTASHQAAELWMKLATPPTSQAVREVRNA